jgi:hypothetical protein
MSTGIDRICDNTIKEATARAYEMIIKLDEAFGDRNLVDRVEILDELETEG